MFAASSVLDLRALTLLFKHSSQASSTRSLVELSSGSVVESNMEFALTLVTATHAHVGLPLEMEDMLRTICAFIAALKVECSSLQKASRPFGSFVYSAELASSVDFSRSQWHLLAFGNWFRLEIAHGLGIDAFKNCLFPGPCSRSL